MVNTSALPYNQLLAFFCALQWEWALIGLDEVMEGKLVLCSGYLLVFSFCLDEAWLTTAFNVIWTSEDTGAFGHTVALEVLKEYFLQK
jgi:hypothetical protein